MTGIFLLIFHIGNDDQLIVIDFRGRSITPHYLLVEIEGTGDQFLKLCQMSLIEILPQYSLDNRFQILDCDFFFAVEEPEADFVGGFEDFQEDAVFVMELLRRGSDWTDR